MNIQTNPRIGGATVAVLKSKVPALLQQMGWDRNTFQGYCRLKGVSIFTANRVFDGAADLRASTLATMVEILGVRSISEIVDVDPETLEPPMR